MGDVRITEARTFNWGKSIPRLPQKSRDQAPPARTTLSQRMRPSSVTTPETRPASVSIPRTAQPVRIFAPRLRAAVAIAGAALRGSARPELGE